MHKPAKWKVSGPWFTDRIWFVENENARIHPMLTRKWFDSRAEARAYVKKLKGRTTPKRTLRRQRSGDPHV